MWGFGWPPNSPDTTGLRARESLLGGGGRAAPASEPGRGFVRRLSLGRAQGGVAVISFGTAAGQAVTLLATPVLSRLYAPAAYGAFASLMALVAIAATAGSLRLESAVPIASWGEARQLVKASAASSLIIGVACAGLLSVLGHQVFSRDPWLAAFLVIYLVWVTAMYAVLTAYSLRSHQFSAVARRNFLRSLGTAGGQLAFSQWLRSALGLTAGLALGRSLGVVSLARESELLTKRQDVADESMLIALKRYWRFPVVFMPSALLNVLGSQLPILVVTRAYGTVSSGNLAQAILFGAIPAALLGTAVSSVVMAEMAARVRAGELIQRARYMRVTRALLPIGLAWFLVLVLLGRPLLPIVLGPQWSESGQYVTALAIAPAVGLIVSPLTVVFLLYERTVVNFLLDIGRVVLVAGLGAAAWRIGYGPIGTVFLMSWGMAVVYVATWLLGLRTVSPPGSDKSATPRTEGSR